MLAPGRLLRLGGAVARRTRESRHTCCAEPGQARKPAGQAGRLGGKLAGPTTPPKHGMLLEEARQLRGCVRPKWVGMRARGAAARPGMAQPVHRPLLDQGLVGGAKNSLGVAVTARYVADADERWLGQAARQWAVGKGIPAGPLRNELPGVGQADRP